MEHELKDWKTGKLGEIFSERTERNFENLRLLAITAAKGIIPRCELDLKDNSSNDKSKYLKICAGDIGYNTMRMWQGVSAYSDYEGIVSPAYTVLKPVNSIDSKYFSYLFKMPEIISMFYRYSQGLVDDTRNLKYQNFKEISVCYPINKKEQQKIAEIFSMQDKLIELKQKLINEKKQQKKWLMQNLLTGKIRLKGFEGEWEKVKLNAVCDIYDGTHETPKYKEQGVKFVSVENIGNISDTNKYISYEDYEKYKVKPQKNDIMMTRIGSVGVCALIESDEKLAYYVSLALLRPNQKFLMSKYLKYIIESFHGIRELRKRTLLNAIPIKINTGDIGKITIPILSLEEQTAIAEILSAQDREIELLEKQLEQEKSKKKALMQLLLAVK